MRKKTKEYLKIFTISIVLPLVVGGLSALLTMSNMNIYKELQQPPLAPPSWLFPVVWTILYVLMGVSFGLYWIARPVGEGAVRSKMWEQGLSFYLASLAFNFAWSILFFNLRWFLFAFVWLIVLLFLIVGTILAYRKFTPVAAYLQIPYALWVAFAGYLNFGIWFLNR